jgi:hypothetical protein
MVNLDEVQRHVTSGRWQLQAYQKRAVANHNLYEDSTHTICVAGTLILDGKLGAGALPGLLNLYREHGPQAARRLAWGHYAVVIVDRDGYLVAFSDENADIPIYYWADDGEVVASTSLSEVSSV